MSFEVTPQHYLALSAVLFGLGTLGVLVRRNALVVLMCIELMLNGGNLAVVAIARRHGDAYGHIIVFVVMAIAAAEAAVGLAIILGVFRSRQTIDLDELDLLRDEA